MDATSPIAARTAGQPSLDSGTSFKSIFGMGLFTLVATCLAGRRWLFGRSDGGNATAHCHHRRYRDHHHRSADGYGRPS